jgi:hypothetical protein
MRMISASFTAGVDRFGMYGPGKQDQHEHGQNSASRSAHIVEQE